MNLLYKLLPDFWKRFFFPEIYWEPEDYGISSLFKKEPCKGSLEIGDHCKGCRFEKEHT